MRTKSRRLWVRRMRPAASARARTCFVRLPAPRLRVLLMTKDVVAARPERPHDGRVEVLVGEKPGHPGSSALVLDEYSIDLVPIALIVRPRRAQVLGCGVRHALPYLAITEAQLA